MSAFLDSDTSDSDDEETTRRLQESVVDSASLIGNISSSKQVVEKESAGGSLKKKNQLSNRPFAEPDENNELKTTPEFRHFVGKKLSSLLDSKLEEVQWSEVSRETDNKSDDDDGIKLLYSSNRLLKGFEEETERNNGIRKRKLVKKNSSSSESSSEDERILEAAVSYDFVMEQSKQLYGTLNRTDVTETGIYQRNEIVSVEQDSGKGDIKCGHKHLVEDIDISKRKRNADFCSDPNNDNSHVNLIQPAEKAKRKNSDNTSDMDRSQSKHKKSKHRHTKNMLKQKK